MSRWKTNFESQKVLEKIQGTLRILQSANAESIGPAEKPEYLRALKVLKLLEVRFTTLDPELFNQNTWSNFSSWFNDIQGYANSSTQSPSYFRHINDRLDEILNVLRPIDLMFSEKEVKALAEAGAIYQQKLTEELERVKKRADEIKKQFGDRADGFDDLWAEGNVRHEVTIHDVEMQPVGTGTSGAFGTLAEAGLIRGEQRRCNYDFHNRLYGL